jgi:signal transduction histidine kinase
MAKTNRKADELVIRIKDARLRQHIEDKARQTGSTPEALVNEVFDDLETAWRTIRLYMTQMAEQRREREELLKQVEAQERQDEQMLALHKEIVAQVRQQLEKPIRQIVEFVDVARTWKESAEKAVALCKKYAVKVAYFETVRRQRDELLSLVERFVAARRCTPTRSPVSTPSPKGR